MKTKILLLSITTFAIFIFSCNSGNDGTSDDDSYKGSDIENKIDTIFARDWNPDFDWDFSCTIFTQSDSDMINNLIELIPYNIRNEFFKLYSEWEEVWIIHDHDDPRFIPEAHVSGTPQSRALLPEYKVLLEFCKKYDKVILPLVIDFYAHNRIGGRPFFSLNLLADLTCKGGIHELFEKINGLFDLRIDNLYIIAPYIHTTDLTVCYCKQLLENEGDNILQAIQDLREAENVAEE